MKQTFILTVADYFVKISSDENYPIFFEEGYANFLQLEEEEKYDATVVCHAGLPEESRYVGEVIFDAVLDKQRLWQVVRTKTERAFIIFNPNRIEEIQQVAFLNDASTEWQVYSSVLTQSNDSFISPLSYPFGALILYYLTLNSNAFMIHASGVWDGETGRIFSGFSGVGKSTMAKIWEEEGAHIENDDRLIVREVKGEYFMYNTPMPYADLNKQAQVSKFYFPFHAKKNSAEKLSGAQGLTQLMAFCFQHNYDKRYTEHLITQLERIIQHTSSYKLGVVPTPSIIDFIRSLEFKG
ncbi:MAG: hypothetical protein ACEQSL_03090 [Sediminibacterium sp.]